VTHKQKNTLRLLSEKQNYLINVVTLLPGKIVRFLDDPLLDEPLHWKLGLVVEASVGRWGEVNHVITKILVGEELRTITMNIDEIHLFIQIVDSSEE